MKYLIIAGLILAIVGTILTGFIAPGGIPKKGDTIKAPNRPVACCGWGLILLGFVAQLIATILG